MNRLKRLYRLYKFQKNLEKLMHEDLIEQDRINISLLYVDDKYKSLVKLWNNIIINLQNKGFKEMQVLEEFMGVKWTRQVLLLIQNEVQQTYLKSIKPSKHAKTTPSPEDLEGVPDEMPISS